MLMFMWSQHLSLLEKYVATWNLGLVLNVGIQEQLNDDKSRKECNQTLMGFPNNRLKTMMCVYYNGTIPDLTTYQINGN